MDAQGYSDCGDDRDQVVFPWIRDQVLQKNPGTILDFGCGDARFACDLARACSAEVHAYDRDSAMRQLARKRIDTAPDPVRLWDAPAPEWQGYFEAIFLQGVWMCWSTREECLQSLSLLHDSLHPKGILIASITHPCFRDREFSTYRTDFSMEHYLKNGAPFHVHVGKPGAEILLSDTHWNLEDTISQALESGLSLRGIKEHADSAHPLPSWLSLIFSRAN